MSAEAAVSALISKAGLVDNAGAPRSLEGKTTLLFYFSAHWCPPCKHFTPELARFYASHADSKTFEIVFVSSDKNEQEFSSYFREMPWASMSWGTMRSLRSSLELAYGAISGIPTLIAVDLATMRLLTRGARSFVSRLVAVSLLATCFMAIDSCCQ
jgi:thiol-disulfide isomerase/thioredoxin